MTSVEGASYKLMDYERRLADRELSALTEWQAEERGTVGDALLERSTFLSYVRGVPTTQALTELFHHNERGSRTTRQATRYLVHGLHEYKGKFNPQMARALINTIDPAATSLLDPFSGSGTTLIEAMRLGLTASGIDQNPLAAWVTARKVEALSLSSAAGLVDRFDLLAQRAMTAVDSAQRHGRATPPPWVDPDDEAYLRHWFPEPVLAALWSALSICRGTPDPVAGVAELALSNIVRQVSWQLPEDLRVRRRPSSWKPPQISSVLTDAFKKARLALTEVENAPALSPDAAASVVLGSSRDSGVVSEAWAKGRRLVVTSPPYATALPYIDTDRLSIVLLGLAPASDIRQLERQLTGSREWRTSEANYWSEAWGTNSGGLPDAILDVLDQIDRNNRSSNAGFRRRAVPTLLYRYFVHMGDTLRALSESMAKGERVVMVVGSNRTGRGDNQVEIRTPELLGKLAISQGYDFTEQIPFETWARYGMHSHNAVNAEDAIVMTVR